MINLKLAGYRRKKKLTQVELAKHLGVSFQSISKWETGAAMPDIVMLSTLADYFEVSLDDLVGRSSPGHRKSQNDQLTYWGKKLDYLQETRKDLWNEDYFEFLVLTVWKFDEPINIVDYGCGYGYLGLKLLPLLPEGSTYTGIDISDELIDEAEKVFLNSSFKTHFIRCDIYDYESSETYDVAICQAVLRHANCPTKILNKMVNSTKVGGKVICIEIDRLTEEIGYFNSMIDYDPFVQFKIFEKFWKNETKRGGRDYSMGIKIPSLLNELGLKNIEARINDKIFTANDKDSINRLMETRGWNDTNIEAHLSRFRTLLTENNVGIDDIESFEFWYRKNVESLNNISDNNMVTFFRGLIISFGEKV
jgi:2-polyprenyl-3-methyl-5-hydroxy-6-metoxy-1,4-benzoquinol methylase/DNA-binding XRE family transcriptional regulator